MMTKKEQEYERLLKQSEEIKRRLDETKAVIDKERDDLIIKAIHETNLSREEAAKLSRLIKYKESFEAIMALDPVIEENVVKRRGRPSKEAKDEAVTKDESEVKGYED